MEWPCLSAQGDGVVLRLRASPNAARTTAEGLRQERLALRVKAPPVEGKANEAVRDWAAEAFGIRSSRITLLRGERGREKDLLLEGLSLPQANQVLDGLLKK